MGSQNSFEVQLRDPEVRVTRSKGTTYIVRVGNSWELVRSRGDVGHSIKYQLRWYDKLGGFSPMASASRDRLDYCPEKCYSPLAKGKGEARFKKKSE